MNDFNPREHLIPLKTRGVTTDYLPVAARIAWFRDQHPDGVMTIEAHTISEQIAIFRACVAVPNGGSAEGWGSETPQDFRDYIEKASTKALGRALAALGYGTLQTGEELDEGPRIADTPQPRQAVRTDEQLLTIVNNDELTDPEKRRRAATTYLGRAQTVAELNQRDAKLTSLPDEDRQKLYRHHHLRLGEQVAVRDPVKSPVDRGINVQDNPPKPAAYAG